MSIEIPQRAKNESDFPQLKVLDKKIIAYAVLCQTTNEEAFMRFHPEYLREDGKGLNESGKTDSRHFWSYGKVREYRQAYEETLQEFFGTKRSGKKDSTEIDESRKENALKSLLNQVMNLVEGGDLDADTLKIVAELFKKVGFLKEDIERQEAPRRYLPCRCHSECQYRLFCEKAIENGEIENECLYCKALAIAQEHGYKYDPTTNLSIPQKDA